MDLENIEEITDEHAERLGKRKGDCVNLDGLKNLSPVAAELLSSAGALSLKGLEELDEDVAVQLAKHQGFLELSGLKTASDAVLKALSKYEGKYLGLDGLRDTSAIGIKALANTKAKNLDLSRLEVISDDALELLVRGRRDFLRLGLQSLSEKQAKIIDLFNGKVLELNSLDEISNTIAESLARLSCDRLSLGGLYDFSESVAERLGSMATDGLSLPGKLKICRTAWDRLLRDTSRWSSSWLRFVGEIQLPESILEHPRLYTNCLINRARMETFLNEAPYSRNPNISGKILSVSAAELLGSARATAINFDLQKLPDDAANALGKHTGDLGIKISSLTPFAAKCLAQRKHRKNSTWRLNVQLDKLDAAEAAELARTRYWLNIYVDCTRMADMDAEQALAVDLVLGRRDLAEALSKYKGDEICLNGLADMETRRLLKEGTRSSSREKSS